MARLGLLLGPSFCSAEADDAPPEPLSLGAVSARREFSSAPVECCPLSGLALAIDVYDDCLTYR